MGTLTLQIHLPPHSPHLPFSVTVDTHSTVSHLKQHIRQHLVLPATAELGLVLDGCSLNDTDSLGKVFENVDHTNSQPRIHLILSSSGPAHSPCQANDEPCSPAPLQFHHQFTSSPQDTQGAQQGSSTILPLQLPTSSIPAEERTPMPGTTERCHNNMIQGSSPSPSITEQKTSMSVPPAYFSPYPQALVPFQYQYVFVNGLPYLAPSYYIPLLHMQQHAIGPGYNSPVNGLHQQQEQNQPQPQREAGGAAIAPEGMAQDQAARGQRRAASLWLLLKLAFGVYLFSQNGSIERIVLLHIAALIIFLHQTGRLRIVRRVPRPPQDIPRDPATNVAAAAAAAAEHPPANSYQVAEPAQTSLTSAATSESPHTTDAAISSVSSKQLDNSKHDNSLQASCEKDRSAKLDPIPAPTPEQDIKTAASSSSTACNRGTQETNATAEQTTPHPPQQQRGSTWRHVEHGILTFIASLIPTPPPENEQLEANAVPAAERAL